MAKDITARASKAEQLANAKKAKGKVRRPFGSAATSGKTWRVDLRNRRLANGLTIDEVARAIGISRACVMRYEWGVGDVWLSVAMKFAAFYGVSLGDIWLEHLGDQPQVAAEEGGASQ